MITRIGKLVCCGVAASLALLAGPEIPPNTSVVFKKLGGGSISADITIGGRLAYQSSYAGSADGKTLTETGSAVGTTEKYKVVYDRQ